MSTHSPSQVQYNRSMAYISLTNRVKDVESRILTSLSFSDPDSGSVALRNLLATIKHQIIDARLAVRDYEYAETRTGQRAHAREARQLLDGLRQQIVQASEYNIFGPADIAQFSAQLDSIRAELT